MSDDFVRDTCKLGSGATCCRYLGRAPDGWRCMKLGPNKALIDARVAAGTFNAKGDNCPGIRQ